jgi:hypothetical protein
MHICFIHAAEHTNTAVYQNTIQYSAVAELYSV